MPLKPSRWLRLDARLPHRGRAGLAAAALLAVVAWLPSCRASRADPAAPAIDMSQYTLTFDESFRDLSISGAPGLGARWFAHTPWAGDFGDARFVGPGPDGPFVLRPHGMSIVARQSADGHWTSGLISSRDRDGPDGRGFAQQYGYFEIKARLPEGPGTWPAFWLIGVDKSKSSSEIDVFEFYGGFSEYYHIVPHIWRGGKGDWDKPFLIRVEPHVLSDRFNTFGVDIGPVHTTYYLNRHQVATMETPEEYRQPFYILANLALGGGWPIDKLSSPLSMDIEYIRAYQHR